MIRRATPADLPALHALIERAYRGDAARAGWTHEADLIGGQRTDLQALEAMLAEPRAAMLVAEEDGALTGCVYIGDRGAAAYLGLLTVWPERQATGLGGELTGAAEAHAEAQGYRSMEMRVIRQRGELIAWYGRRGYTDTGRREPFPYGDTRFGLPKRDDLEFVILAKPLG